MLDVLRFVQGSIAKKDLVPSLSHFVIKDGRIQGYDGTLSISAPIPLDIDCKPKGETMVRAIAACGDHAISLTVTPGGKLSIKAGSSRFLIECYPNEDTPHTSPEGETHPIDGQKLYDAFVELAPLIGNDASRPWSNGILFDGPSFFATNNVVLAQIWTGIDFPSRICIPGKAVREIVRVKQPPIAIQLANTAVTFHYSDGRWIRTQLLDAGAWPDIGAVLDRQCTNPPVEFDTRIFDALRTIKPFSNKLNQVFFGAGKLSTSAQADDGAIVDMPDCQQEGIYSIDMVLTLEGIVKKIDWTSYPKPCLWFGNAVRGAIVGQRGL